MQLRMVPYAMVAPLLALVQRKDVVEIAFSYTNILLISLITVRGRR